MAHGCEWWIVKRERWNAVYSLGFRIYGFGFVISPPRLTGLVLAFGDLMLCISSDFVPHAQNITLRWSYRRKHLKIASLFHFYIPLTDHFCTSCLNGLHHIASALHCCCWSAFRQCNSLLSFSITMALLLFAVTTTRERIYASTNHTLPQKRSIAWHAVSM